MKEKTKQKLERNRLVIECKIKNIELNRKNKTVKQQTSFMNKILESRRKYDDAKKKEEEVKNKEKQQQEVK